MSRLTSPMAWIGRVLAVASVTLLLAGCVAGQLGELQQWMAQQRSTVKPRVEPITEPTRFVPQTYDSAAAVSPFSPDKLALLLSAAASSGAPSPLLTAELRRRREPLEDTPLDTIAMVGLLDKQGRKVALLRVGGLLYQVRVGNYLGQNYGRITGISETEITLREIVQDAAGEWIERPASLLLQEGSSK
jgi:type IV pilus assembly protein PilP